MISIGEIVGRLRLQDELTPGLQVAATAVQAFNQQLTGVIASTAAAGAALGTFNSAAQATVKATQSAAQGAADASKAAQTGAAGLNQMAAAATSTSGAMSGLGTSTAAALGRGFSQAVSGARQALAGIPAAAHAASNGVASAAAAVVQAGRGAADMVRGGFDALGKAGQSAGQWLKGLGGAVATDFGRAWQAGGQLASGALEKVKFAGSALLSAADDFGRQTWGAAWGKASELASSALGRLRSTMTSLGSSGLLGSAAAAFGRSWATASEMASNAMGRVRTAAGTLVSAMGNLGGQAASAFGRGWQAASEGVATAFQRTRQAAASLIAAIDQAGRNRFGIAWVDAVETVQAALNRLRAVVAPVTTALSTLGGQAASLFARGWQAAGQGVEQAFLRIRAAGDSIRTGLADLGGAAASVFGRGWTAAAAMVEGAFGRVRAAGSQIGSALAELGGQAASAFGRGWASAADVVSGAFTRIQSAGQAVASGLADLGSKAAQGFASGWAAAGEAVSTALGRIRFTADALVSAMADLGGQAASTFARGWAEASRVASDALGRVKFAGDALLSAVADLGNAIGARFAAGWEAASSAATAAIGRIAQAAQTLGQQTGLSGATDSVGRAWQAAADTISRAFQAIKANSATVQYVSASMSAAAASVSKAWVAAVDTAQSAIGRLKSAVGSIGQAVGGSAAAQSIAAGWTAASQTAANAINRIKQAVSGLSQSSTVTTGASTLGASWQNASNMAVTAIGRLKTAIGSLGSGAVNSGRDVAGWIRSVWQEATRGEGPVKKFRDALGGLNNLSFSKLVGVPGITSRITAGFVSGQLAIDAFYGTFRLIGGVVSNAIDQAKNMQNAMVGLSSVAMAYRDTKPLEGSDEDFKNITEAADKATAAAKNLAKDGLMTVNEAAMGMKNLLATNFTMDQSIDIMKRFKDMAAFTRQGTLDFGEAIVGATQGLKNQQSMMVDNVGLTKNLSVILREAGYGQGALGEATSNSTIRLALFNGIMKESTAQVGDAARLASTYQGQIMRLQTAWNMMSATWGAAIVENRTVAEALKFVADMMFDSNNEALRGGKAWVIVSDAVIGVVKAFSFLLSTLDLVQAMGMAIKAVFDGVVFVFVKASQYISSFFATAVRGIGFALQDSSMAQWADQLDSDTKNLQASADGWYNSMKSSIQQSNEWHATLSSGTQKLDELAESLKKTRGEIVNLDTGARGRVTAAAERNKEIDKLKANTGKLAAEITRAAAVMDSSQLFERYGKKASDAAAKLKGFGLEVPKAIESLSQERDFRAFDKVEGKLESTTNAMKAFIDGQEEAFKSSKTNFDAYAGAMDEYFAAQHEMATTGMTPLAKSISDEAAILKAKIATITEGADGYEAAVRAFRDASQMKIASLVFAELTKNAEDFWQVMNEGDQTITDSQRQLNALEHDLSKLSIGLGIASEEWVVYANAKALADAKGAEIIRRDEIEKLYAMNQAGTALKNQLQEMDRAAHDAATQGLTEFFDKLVQIGQLEHGGLGDLMGAIDNLNELKRSGTATGAELAEASAKVSRAWRQNLIGTGAAVMAGFKLARDESRKLGQDYSGLGESGMELGGHFGVLSTVFNKSAKGVERFRAGLMAAAGVAAGAVSVWQATGESVSRAGRAMSGAMAGAQAGAMFGPWGAAIGAGIGAIVGALRNPGWVKASKEIMRDYGVEISKELAKSIADTADKEFRGDRFAAGLLHLSDIIKEAGGLTVGNLDQMTSRLRDVFVMLDRGIFSTAQAMDVLEQNWTQFAEAGTNATGRLSDGLREILKLAIQTGTVTKSMLDYMKSQADIAGNAFGDIVGASSAVTQSQDLAKAVKDAQDAVDKLRESGKTAGEEWDTAQGKLTDALTAQHRLAESAGQELSDLGQIALGVVATQLALGASLADALKAAGPGLQALAQAYADLGISAEDAGVKMLLMQAQLMTNAPKLVNGIDALGKSLTALGNIGGLTTNSFSAMQRTGLRMYTQLQAEVASLGGDTRDALLPMQDYLHRAQEEAAALGVPLDENTQMLIDQSRELGIWKDQGKSATQVLIDGVKSMTDAIEHLIRVMQGIPDELPDPTRNWKPPGESGYPGGDGGGSGGGTGDGGTGGGGPNFAASATNVAAQTALHNSLAFAPVVAQQTGDLYVLPVIPNVSVKEQLDAHIRALPGIIGRNEYGVRVAIQTVAKEAVR